MRKGISMSTPKVVVIGAGIVGAAVAYELTRAGAHVCLVDRRPQAGLGVTAQSFGWVNYVTAEPGDPAGLYGLRRAALDDYAHWNEQFDGHLFAPGCGSLVWRASEAETAELARIHGDQGTTTRLIDQEAFTKLAPAVATPPTCAVHSPDEIAVDSDEVAERLVQAAGDNGAQTIFGAHVDRVLCADGTVTGVEVAGDPLFADVVVVAGGLDGGRIIPPGLPDLGIESSPAVLVSMTTEPLTLEGVLQGPGLELRARDATTLHAAASAPEAADPSATARLGQDVLATAKRTIRGIDTARVTSVAIGARPMPRDNRPVVGRYADVPNLMFAVGHPGVILAPAIARTITQLVHDQSVATGIDAMVL